MIFTAHPWFIESVLQGEGEGEGVVDRRGDGGGEEKGGGGGGKQVDSVTSKDLKR